MRRLFFIWLMCLSVCVVYATTGNAGASTYLQDTTEVRLPIDLDEVTVVAPTRETAVIPAQQLSGERLQELSAHSVADALRYFSGVQVKEYGGIGGLKTVDMRSLGSHHLGVFYDGIEVGNAQNGTVDLGKFSLDNIEELSLYNGQRSEMLQSAKDYGSAGSLYIRTRRPSFARDKNYNVHISMKAGAFGLANPGLLYEQKLTDNVHLSANAEYIYSTGRYHFRIHGTGPDGSVAWDTTGIRQDGDIQAFRGEMGLFGYLPSGKWHVKGYYYQSERGIPRPIVRNVWTSAQRQWDRNAFVQGAFQYEVAKRWEVLVSAKYSNDYMRYLNPDTTMLYLDNRFWQQEVYVSMANKVRIFSWWDMALSGDYIFNTLDATLTNFVYPTRHTGLVALATSFHYKWLRAQANVLGTFVHDAIAQPNRTTPQAAMDRHRFTPAVYLSYQPLLDEQLFLRAFYKQIFRMPTFNDLYYTDVGNIALEPETATQYDGGVEWTHAFSTADATLPQVDVRLKADGYFNQVKNKIIATPKGNSQYRWQMMNLGYVEIRGLDLNAGLTFRFTHEVALDLAGTYTFQKAQDFTTPGAITYGGQIAYVPLHAGSALANLSWRGWTLNYSFIYVGERYHNSANIVANYEPAWYTHDLSVNKMWNIRTRSYDFGMNTTIEINNLLNQQYNIIDNYPMPGINGKVIIAFIL